MKIMRVLLYEGDDVSLERQIKLSLPVGHHKLSTGQLTIVELRNFETIREIAAVAYLRTEAK